MLCGWAFSIQSFKAGLLGAAPIEANTALGLIFLGVSLWMLLPDPPRPVRRYWGLFFGALPAVLGSLTLAEYISGHSLGIDQFLFTQTPAFAAVYPAGRMAPITAATFAALGLALLLVDWEPRTGRRPAQVLTLVGVVAALMSLSGYINAANPIYRVFSFTPVAVFTSLILMTTSVAIFLARPRAGICGDLTGRYVGSAMARRFLPAVVVIPLIAAWVRLHGERADLFGIELGLSLNVVLNVVSLSILLWMTARQLNKAEESLEEIREAKNVLYDSSLRDELTGLYNRRGFLTFAEEHIKLACSGRR